MTRLVIPIFKQRDSTQLTKMDPFLSVFALFMVPRDTLNPHLVSQVAGDFLRLMVVIFRSTG